MSNVSVKSGTPAPRRAVPKAGLRFPCGHVESERGTKRRMRTNERAAWIACRRCNVIALVIAKR
jgi:hypothetical protein